MERALFNKFICTRPSEICFLFSNLDIVLYPLWINASSNGVHFDNSNCGFLCATGTLILRYGHSAVQLVLIPKLFLILSLDALYIFCRKYVLLV